MDKHLVTSKGTTIKMIKEDNTIPKNENREDLERVIQEILKNHNINNQIKLVFND